MDALRELDLLHARFGAGLADRKRILLDELRVARLASAREVSRLHELALFLCAAPDAPEVLAAARRVLDGFARRRDLQRHAGELADSGIAGTATRFRFFLPTALRLARAFPGQLALDRPEWGREPRERLAALLPLLARSAEGLAVSEERLDADTWLARGRARGEGEGAFLARVFAGLPAAPEVRAQIWDELDPPLLLEPGPGVPARTHARAAWMPVVFQRHDLRRERPVLVRALRRPPRAIERVRGDRACELVRLAQDAMAARARDLDAFMHADARDVRLVDCGEGLSFAMLGVLPAQRLPLEAVHAFLTLRNGVPIGYVLSSALFGSCEVAYNVFETWRGAEAGHVYGRVLAMLRALFRADTFTIYPYQLGHGNDEGLRSGAWWFYQKLGFRPDDAGVRGLMRSELARLRREPQRRSARPVLARLARANLYWSCGPRRSDVIGRAPLGRIGLAALAPLAQHGSEAACAEAAARALGLRSRRGWSREERQAFERLAPIALALPDLERWSVAERRDLVHVLRAKGRPDEVEYVRAFDAHLRLRRGLCALARVRSSV